MIIDSKSCPGCGGIAHVQVAPEQAHAIAHRTDDIQNIVPQWNADLRERFISGYCVPCWDKLFGGEDD